MPRDYAKRGLNRSQKKRRQSRQKSVPWKAIVIVILLLVFLIGGLSFISHRIAHHESIVSEPPPVKTLPVKKGAPVESADDSTSDKKDQPDIQFQFYNMLPKMKVNIEPDSSGTAEKKTAELAHQTIILQLSTLNDENEAKDLQEKLHLQGIRTVIIPIKQAGVLSYRMQAGPYHDNHSVTNDQTKLDAINIPSVMEYVG